MTELREATEAATAAWQQDWKARLQGWYAHPDVPAGWVAGRVAQRLARQAADGKGAVFAIVRDGAVAGTLAVSSFEEAGRPAATINDLHVTEQYRGRGIGAEALRLAEDWAREQGASTVWVLTDPAQPAHAALFARYPVRAQHMIRQLSGRAELAPGLTGRPMTEAEFGDWRDESVRGYAADMADSGSIPAGDALSASAAQFDQELPGGLQTADHTFLSLEAGGEVVATNWIYHHRMAGLSWVYGVEVHEGQRGHGYGRAAMVIGENATLDAGDTHLALNVFGHNYVAISLYQSMGYRAYDQGRSAEL